MLQRIDKSIISQAYPFKIDVLQPYITLDLLVMMSQFSSLHICLIPLIYPEEISITYSAISEEPLSLEDNLEEEILN